MKKLFTALLLVLVGVTLTGCTKDKNTDQQIDPPTQRSKITDIFKNQTINK